MIPIRISAIRQFIFHEIGSGIRHICEWLSAKKNRTSSFGGCGNPEVATDVLGQGNLRSPEGHEDRLSVPKVAY